MSRWDLLNTERIQSKAHVYDFTLWPKAWDKFDDRLIFTWQKRRFSESAINDIPESPGVYSFVVKPRIANHPACAFLVYTGQASNLRSRFKQYLAVQQGRRRHSPIVELGLSQHVGGSYLYFYYSLHSKRSLDKYEQTLIDGFIPPWNSKRTVSSSVGNIVRAY